MSRLSVNSLFLIILLFISFQATAQEYLWAKPVNPNDSGQVTAQAVSPMGDIFVASYRNATNSAPGNNFGLAGAYPSGQLVLTRLNSNGVLVWTKSFPNSRARIFELKIDSNHDLIFSGGYYDSLTLSPQAQYAGKPLSSGNFIAKFDTTGNHIWSLAAVPSTNTSFVSFAFDVFDSMIVESGYFNGIEASIRKLDLSGNILDSLQFTNQVRVASDVEIDSIGNIYIAGGGFSFGFIDSIQIPSPPSGSIYTNYVAKLDANLNALWVRSTGHITLDLDPKVELFSSQVAFLSNVYSTGFGGPNSFKLNYYDTGGSLLHTDSVTNVYFSGSAGRLGLSGTESHVLLTVPVGDTVLLLKKINSAYQDTILTTIKCRTLNNFPRFGMSDDALFFTSSFYTSTAIVHGMDTIYNALGSGGAGGYYRQMLVKFGACGVLDTSVSVSGVTLNSNASGVMYQWLDCNSMSAIPGATNSSYAAAANGSYAVEITQGGCVDTSDCHAVTVTGIFENPGYNLKVYPNPVSDILTVESGTPVLFVTVRDVMGKELIIRSADAIENRIELQLNSITPGSYILKITTIDGVFYRKILVQ